MKGSKPSSQTCHFCKKYTTYYLSSHGNHYRMEIDSVEHVAAIWEGDECLSVFSINNCPMCGRYLREDNPSKD